MNEGLAHCTLTSWAGVAQRKKAGDLSAIRWHAAVMTGSFATADITATENQPLRIQWVPEPAVEAEVIVHLDNDHHGINSFVECRVPDASGEVTIPAATLNPLIADGETGIGSYIENAFILRRRRSAVATPWGCAALSSSSSTFLIVETVRVPRAMAPR